MLLKSGRLSGCSAQHCLMIFIASGGAAPLLTDGRIKGGGRFTFSIISETNRGFDQLPAENNVSSE